MRTYRELGQIITGSAKRTQRRRAGQRNRRSGMTTVETALLLALIVATGQVAWARVGKTLVRAGHVNAAALDKCSKPEVSSATDNVEMPSATENAELPAATDNAELPAASDNAEPASGIDNTEPDVRDPV